MTDRKFTKNTKVFMFLSAAILVVALVMNIIGFGLNLGIDFTGGSLLEYAVGEEFDTEEVVSILRRHGYTDAQVTRAAASGDDSRMTNLQIRLSLVDQTAEMKDAVKKTAQDAGLKFTGEQSLTNAYVNDNAMDTAFTGGTLFAFAGNADSDALKTAVEDALTQLDVPFTRVFAEELDDDPENLAVNVIVVPDDQSGAVRAILEGEMSQKYPGFTYVSIEHAGAVSSADLVRNAVLSLVIALALMLVYIAFRFDLYSGLAAMLGLAHDVAMMLAFMTFFRGVYQINSSFIAAILTIVGYSINNTIIIFDRVRENKRAAGTSIANIDIVEKSVSHSFSRTVNTTLTTLFTLVALFVLGVDSIREFTFPLLVGLLSGVYSATLLNGPVWAHLMNRADARKAAKAHSEKA